MGDLHSFSRMFTQSSTLQEHVPGIELHTFNRALMQSSSLLSIGVGLLVKGVGTAGGNGDARPHNAEPAGAKVFFRPRNAKFSS